MKTLYFNFHDKKRARDVPVAVYLPEGSHDELPVVLFGPGYQGQEYLQTEELVYKSYTYLANYFTSKNYAFITIQHDVLGDMDGLETIDTNAVQDTARKHLYIRGEENILFALEELQKQNFPICLDKLIMCGHSNGGDIVKYFANNNPDFVKALILLDARRAFFRPQKPLPILMFEADDTTTDDNVIAYPEQGNNSMRSNVDLIVMKPSGALHQSYSDEYITEGLKQRVFLALDMFLSMHGV